MNKIDNNISKFSNVYNITFAINRPYLLFCMVTLYSLLKNNPSYFFNIYILHNDCLKDNEIQDVCAKNPLNQFNNFKIHLVDVLKITTSENIQNNDKWTQEVFFKIFLPDLLPKVDKILYLDVDVIIRGDIKDFLDTNMDNYLFYGERYFINSSDICLGVLLCNLDLARKLKTTQTLLAFIKEQTNKYKNNHYMISEEYAVNMCIKEKKADNTYISSLKNPTILDSQNIIHFITTKPWHINKKINTHYKMLYKEYLKYLKEFSKTKIIIIAYYYYILYIGYFFNSIFRRLRNFIYKYFFKLPKYKHIHSSFSMSLFKTLSIIKKE